MRQFQLLEMSGINPSLQIQRILPVTPPKLGRTVRGRECTRGIVLVEHRKLYRSSRRHRIGWGPQLQVYAFCFVCAMPIVNLSPCGLFILVPIAAEASFRTRM